MLLRILLIFAVSFLPCSAIAQVMKFTENQVKTCEIRLSGKPAAKECAGIFKTKVNDCCVSYDDTGLAKLCAKMSSVENALACYSEINEEGFIKRDLLPEYIPGLAREASAQWKSNVIRECSSKPTNKAALDCAILQKSGTKVVYQEKNEAGRQQEINSDPIMQFCRKAFGENWEGVEDCVSRQRAAKKRMGL